MAKKSKAKDAKKQPKQTGKEKAPSAAKSGGTPFERAFAKIAPPKGFAIKRP